MFDKIFDLIIQALGLFKFWAIMNPNNLGFVVTWGKITRRIGNADGWFGTGFHLKAPFDIEEVFWLSSATRVDEFAAQTLVTKDGKNVIIGVIVTYRVHDVDKAMNSVFEPFAAIADAVQANVADAVISTDYAAIPTMAFSDALTVACRKRGFTYGFEIDSVRIGEFAPTRTYRLMGDGAL